MLLSSTEQTDLLGFLDRFEWDFDPTLPQGMPSFPMIAPAVPGAPGGSGLGLDMSGMGSIPGHQMEGVNGNSDHEEANQLLGSPHDGMNSFNNAPTSPRLRITRSTSQSQPRSQSNFSPIIALPHSPTDDSSNRRTKRRKSSPSSDPPSTLPSAPGNGARPAKPLLTQPQKRLNHIMSEQRRRTAIKEGFATIERLIAPDPQFKGPAPTLPPPLDKDGKPRRGVKTKGLRGKGKMGSLFRASEFLNHLEEGIAGLTLEVERFEAAVRASHGSHSVALQPSELGLNGTREYGV